MMARERSDKNLYWKINDDGGGGLAGGVVKKSQFETSPKAKI